MKLARNSAAEKSESESEGGQKFFSKKVPSKGGQASFRIKTAQKGKGFLLLRE